MSGCFTPSRRQRQGMCWNWWRPETRYPPLSSAPSMTPVSGMRTCTIPPWPMPSVIGSSTTHTQSKLRASPCASARPSPSKLRHGGSVHHASGRHAPFHRNGCTIRAEPVHHLLRSYCTLGAVYAFSQAPVGSSSFLRQDTKIPPVVSFGRYFV